MQCVRCQHPLPPRADRCLRCFALNPQNHPEPLAPAAAQSSSPLGALKLKPLGLSFESDPPPAKNALDGLSFESDPPLRRASPLDIGTPAPRGLTADFSLQSEPASAGPQFTPLDEPDFSFGDPSFAKEPVRIIDILSRPPGIPDTIPAPPPSGMQPRASTPPHARLTEPAITPMPDIDLPVLPYERAPAPLADARSSHLDQLAEKALRLSDPDVPLEALAQRQEAKTSEASDFAGFQRPAPELEPGPAPGRSAEIADAGPISTRPALRARLTAWALDAAVILGISLLFVALAALQLGGRKLAPLGQQSWESWADGLLFAHRLPIFWALLAAAIGLGYSWLFTSLGGRTPGMRWAGLKLQHEDGSPIDPVQALARAALSLPSAALCLFGFVLALVDPRGQTLHDKLCHSLLVVSADAPRGSS
jgi:uncharacterized RDD family membrane protein YckC